MRPTHRARTPRIAKALLFTCCVLATHQIRSRLTTDRVGHLIAGSTISDTRNLSSKSQGHSDGRWILWPQDRECSRFSVSFGSHLPRAWLFSFPGSGNTWTRYLLEAATGIFTGSVYRDSQLYNMGFLGEFEPHTSSKTLLKKNHFKCTGRNPGRDKVVLLLRKPKDCIITLFGLMTSSTHLSGTPVINSTEFHSFIPDNLLRWEELATSCLLVADDVLVVFYERLKENPMGELKRILNYLGLGEDQERLACLKRHLRGPARRVSGKAQAPFTRRELSEALKVQGRVEVLLRLRDIPSPW